jgi:hypothetical protein
MGDAQDLGDMQRRFPQPDGELPAIGFADLGGRSVSE